MQGFIDLTIAGREKVRKKAKIRNQYNQVPHLTKDTTWESTKNTRNITYKSQEVSPFPAGDHKAATDRCESMRDTKTQMIHKRSTALERSVKITGVLKSVSCRQPHP